MFSSRMSEEDMGQLAAKDPVENIVSEGSSQEAEERKDKDKKDKEDEIPRPQDK